jgi:thiosulfate/3-mercaptopyruvate sulfurtransferase
LKAVPSPLIPSAPPLNTYPSPLISASNLRELLNDADLGVVDCRFSLADPERGEEDWMDAAIPGAVYAHLDRDLSDMTGDISRGRHPLPSAEQVRALMASWGFTDDTSVVCYDDAGGPFAARLWWLLRWIGHEAVAVLDGGWQAWLAANGATEAGKGREPVVELCPTGVQPESYMVADASELLAEGCQPVDARALSRYLGDEEPIDPVAGHIPSAISMPWMGNLMPDGRFLPAQELAARWQAAGGTQHAVCYCGSGVTACHNILAAAAANLPLPRLYPPSWSGWISDPTHPLAKGRE